MKKSWKVLLAALLLVAASAGCANNKDDNGHGNMETNRVRTNDIGDNDRLRVSDKAGKAVERLDQVDRAHVIIEGNKAYVAVRSYENDGMDNGTDGNAVKNDGKVDQNGNDGMINGKGDAGNKGKDGNMDMNAADDGADDFGIMNEKGNGADDGNIVRERNYTGATTAFEKSIAAEVRKAEKGVDKVYISFNDDFFNTMGGYANDLNDGRDMDGLWNDFTGTVGNLFGR